jgi:hypothetical protein
MKMLDIVFPAAGVGRRLALTMSRATSPAAGDEQRTASSPGRRAPFPAVWAMNMRLEDELTNRLRGGSFTPPSAGTKASPVYRSRAITFTGRRISASRVGHHSDFDFDSDASDQRRPRRFQLSEAKGSGGTVVAVVPHKDSFLLGFTATETWVLSGDPNGGTLRRVSDQVGIIGANAWCVAHDTVYFLSSSGLYSVQADGSDLRPVSEDNVPEDLTGVVDSDCVLDYRHSDRGVFIHRSPNVSWLYDTARNGFWPFQAEESSHILCGPFRLGSPNTYGRVLKLIGITASNSADVTWSLVTGDTAEAAAVNGKAAITTELAGDDYSGYVSATGTWTAGRSHTSYPKTRAIWCCLWLMSSGTWAYEAVRMVTKTSGAWR